MRFFSTLAIVALAATASAANVPKSAASNIAVSVIEPPVLPTPTEVVIASTVVGGSDPLTLVHSATETAEHSERADDPVETPAPTGTSKPYHSKAKSSTTDVPKGPKSVHSQSASSSTKSVPCTSNQSAKGHQSTGAPVLSGASALKSGGAAVAAVAAVAAGFM
ncbi:hypothetical protein HKX48_005097 [Thoreauomyces humboldtii]|nr:hypothetical protein HKX48_005097 [Thoreauomyces humboldtii]